MVKSGKLTLNVRFIFLSGFPALAVPNLALLVSLSAWWCFTHTFQKMDLGSRTLLMSIPGVTHVGGECFSAASPGEQEARTDL